LSLDLIDPHAVEQLRGINGGREAILLPVTALEITGINTIPDAMAQTLAEMLNWPVSLGDVVQTNKVGHTRAHAFNPLVTPAAFEGRVRKGADYVLVDDHVGVGGTLANLKGFLETNGGRVVGMTTLTESRDARQIALRPEVLGMLKRNMAKNSKISGNGSSATASSASRTSKAESFVVSNRLRPSEIASLKLFSKRVNAVSLHGSKTVSSPNGGSSIRKTISMPKDQLFVERRDQGDYAVRRGDSERVSAVAATQAEAIARAKQLNPGRAPLVERVRNTDIGQRDKWRRA
jgi:hypothetical protein